MDVIDLRYLDNFRLHLEFADGTQGVADLENEIASRKAFASLRHIPTFRRAHIEGGTVAWPGGLDLAAERLYALTHHLPPPTTIEEAEANAFKVSLRELRRLSDVRQEDLATTLEVTQGAVSRMESSDGETKLATLKRYLSALGWDLEVVAVKGDRRLS